VSRAASDRPFSPGAETSLRPQLTVFHIDLPQGSTDYLSVSPALWIPVLAVVAFSLTACAPKPQIQNTLSTGSELSFAGHGVDNLHREDYEALGIAEGRDRSASWFVLWFPVGGIRSKSEIIDGAYYDAVESVPGCDGLLVPRVKSQRYLVPLLLVNVVVRRHAVKGRCFHIISDRERANERDAGPPPPERSGP